jgi:predicted amidohydrolase YtcJ
LQYLFISSILAKNHPAQEVLMPSADLVLKNARVITMDAARPAATLVAVTGDTISFVGDQMELDSVTGVGTRVIDCDGRAVLPGFNDAHLHLFSLVRKLLGIDLSPAAVRSIADIQEKIREKARNTPPGTWLSGTDFNEFYLAEKHYPTRYDLDEAAPHHPVLLSHRSLHICVLNSLALSLARITVDTEEPAGGRIERDPVTGEPNGILIGMLGYIHREVMPPLADAELADGISMANRRFLSLGITSVQDATVSNNLERWETVSGFILDKRLRSRITLMAGAPYWQDFRAVNLKTGSGDNLIRLGAVKIMPAVRPDRVEFKSLALDIHRAGFQLAFHAVAESEVLASIEALEYVDDCSKVKGRRHRIEHCSECPPHLLECIRKLGLVIVTQPPFIYSSGERYLATVPESQLPWLYRIKTPLVSGVIVAGSSDAPVAPENPLVGIYAAVTRRAASGQVLLPEERINIGQALALYTTNAAYASFEEDIKGSLASGKLADMVVLSDNPLETPPAKIKDIKVEMTIIGGEVVWEG